MPSIKPLHKLTREEVRDLAHAAADRGEPMEEANVFAPEAPGYHWFRASHQERSSELCTA